MRITPSFLSAALLGSAVLLPSSVYAEESTYTESDALIANPERGLYRQATGRGNEPIDPYLFDAMEEADMTLMLRLYYLNEFRDGPIDDERLQLMRDDLAQIRESGMKVILRFAYNEEIGQPDAPIDVVLQHMDQVGEIISENADIIAVVQAGFVGSWGEWHASTNDLREPVNAKQILGKWLDILPPERFVQVRTPAIKWMLVDTDEPIAADATLKDTPRARIAHHNDCFLATVNDMGTYENPEAEKEYLHQETMTLPMGGETCAVAEFNAPDIARKELEQMHWSYLHNDYHPEVIDGWRESGFLDEVIAKLGYRLVLDRAELPDTVQAGGEMDVALDLRNVGWAAPYNPRTVELLLVGPGGEHRVALDVDPRHWQPGETQVRETVKLPAGMAAGSYEVMLALPDPMSSLKDEPAYAIQLANEDVWDAESGANKLDLTVEVTAGGSAK